MIPLLNTEKICAVAVDRHRILSILSLLICSLSLAFIGNLNIATDMSELISSSDPRLALKQQIDSEFDPAQSVAIYMLTEEFQVYEPQALQALISLSKEAEKLPLVMRVDSLASALEMRSVGDTLVVESVINSEKPPSSPSELKDIRSAVESSTFNKVFVSESGRSTVLNLILSSSDLDSDQKQEIYNSVTQLIHEFRNYYPKFHFEVVGDAIFSYELEKAIESEIWYFLILGMIGAQVALSLLRIPPYMNLITVCVVVVSTATVMGLAAMTGMVLTGPSLAAPLLICVLGIADCMHVLTTYNSNLHTTSSRADALSKSLSENFVPIIITSLTTAIGFLGLNFTDLPGIRNFGNLVAVGAIIALLFTFTLLPSLTLFFRPTSPRNQVYLANLMRRLNDNVMQRPFIFFLITCTTAAIIAPNIYRLNVDDHWINEFSKGSEFRDSIEYISQQSDLGGSLIYRIEAGGEGAIHNSEFLHRLNSFSEWLMQQDGVNHVFSYVDLVKSLHQLMDPESSNLEPIPDNPQLASQYLLLYELGLPEGSSINNLINPSRSAIKLTILLENLSSSQISQLEENAQSWLASHHFSGYGIGTGFSIIFAEQNLRIIHEFVQGALFSLALITLLITLFLRSISFGLISIIANSLPIIVVFGLWGILFGVLDNNSIALLTISLGIIVDDTVHILTRYRINRKMGVAPKDAIAITYRSTGPAIFATTLILALSTSVLNFSDISLVQYIAWLLSPILLVALLYDLLLLPYLLLVSEKSRLLL